MSGSARVGVVILNWNDAPATVDCVRSVLDSEHRPQSVVVVDNASSPASFQDLVNAQGDLDFELLQSPVNGGYGAGNNLGLGNLGNIDYAFVLNNDAVVHRSTIGTLVETLERSPQAGIATPRIVNQDGQVWFGGGSYHRYQGVAVHHGFGSTEAPAENGHGEIGFATGCALLIRKEVLDTVGGFDESFFLYWEDVEYSRRIIAAGWKILFCPSTTVVHRRGQSGDPIRNLSPEMLFYSTRNRLIYLRSAERGMVRLSGLLYTPVVFIKLLVRVLALPRDHRWSRVCALLRGVGAGMTASQRSGMRPVAEPGPISSVRGTS